MIKLYIMIFIIAVLFLIEVGLLLLIMMKSYSNKNDIMEQLTSSLNIYLQQKTLNDSVDIQGSSMMIQNTTDLITIIDQLINREVENIFQRLASLKKKYEIINLDKDIMMIATNVKNAISDEYINNSGTVLTNDYIYRYIIMQTTGTLISVGKEYNDTLMTIMAADTD